MFKEKGTGFFKQGKFPLATKKYKKIVEFLEHEISLKGNACYVMLNYYARSGVPNQWYVYHHWYAEL